MSKKAIPLSTNYGDDAPNLPLPSVPFKHYGEDVVKSLCNNSDTPYVVPSMVRVTRGANLPDDMGVLVSVIPRSDQKGFRLGVIIDGSPVMTYFDHERVVKLSWRWNGRAWVEVAKDS